MYVLRHSAVQSLGLLKQRGTTCDFVGVFSSSSLFFYSQRFLPLRKSLQVPTREPTQGTSRTGSAAWIGRRRSSLIGLHLSPRRHRVWKKSFASTHSGRQTTAASRLKTMGEQKDWS